MDPEHSSNIPGCIRDCGPGTRRQSLLTASVEILEQPADVRFRFKTEDTKSRVMGVKSTPTDKTYPTIQVHGYEGPAVVVVSCVTKDFPFRPHPHCLVGENCKDGIFQKKISCNGVVSFTDLNIECTRKRDTEQVLTLRKDKRIDPFQTGFAQSDNLSTKDMNYVRLCFHVIVQGENSWDPLAPVVSRPILNKKSVSPLKICKLSQARAPVEGGTEIMLLCEKVDKDDIQIRFFEDHSNWTANAVFQPSDVHKGFGIFFRTPQYRTCQIENTVTVRIQLIQPSIGAEGDALPFEFFPTVSYHSTLKRKKAMYGDSVSSSTSLSQINSNLLQMQQSLSHGSNYRPQSSVPSTSTSPPYVPLEERSESNEAQQFLNFLLNPELVHPCLDVASNDQQLMRLPESIQQNYCFVPTRTPEGPCVSPSGYYSQSSMMHPANTDDRMEVLNSAGVCQQAVSKEDRQANFVSDTMSLEKELDTNELKEFGDVGSILESFSGSLMISESELDPHKV